MRLHCTRSTGPVKEWLIWATLDHTQPEELRTSSESFIIASGPTIAEAVSRAQVETTQAFARLRQDVGAQL